jgi:hypothetical protein
VRRGGLELVGGGLGGGGGRGGAGVRGAFDKDREACVAWVSPCARGQLVLPAGGGAEACCLKQPCVCLLFFLPAAAGVGCFPVIDWVWKRGTSLLTGADVQSDMFHTQVGPNPLDFCSRQ